MKIWDGDGAENEKGDGAEYIGDGEELSMKIRDGDGADY